MKNTRAWLIEYARAWIAAHYRDLRNESLLPSPNPAFGTRQESQ